MFLHQKLENEGSTDFEKPVLFKNFPSPKTYRDSKATKPQTEKRGSPNELYRKNPKLYSHKKNVEPKLKKRGVLDKTSELFEIKDLDLKPIASFKNL